LLLLSTARRKERIRERKMSILIKNGQVIDPATQKDEISDVLIENGVITRVEKGIRVKDCAGNRCKKAAM